MGETQTLKQRSVQGFKWAILDNLANQGITFLVGIVLANFITPEEFGILGILIVLVNLSTTIIDGGFVTALVRKNDANDADYNTALYSNLGISVVLMLLLILISPLLANFFSQPLLSELIPVMSVILLINAFSLIPKTQFTKRIDFRRQAIASLIASVCSGTLGIVLAMKGLGVWSLVWQQITRQLLLTVCFWLMNNWRPKLMFSTESFKDLFGFGSRLLAANIINTLFKDALIIVIGKMYTPRVLGLYNRAEQFNLIVSNNMAQVIQRVSMPTLSLVQDDIQRLKATFRKFEMFTSMLTFALAFGLAAAAKPLILTLINEEWLPCAKYIQMMSLYAAIYPLHQLNLNILNVTKHSDYFLRLEIIKKFVFAPVIAVGFIFEDVEAMIWAAVIYYHIEFILNSWYSHRLIGFGTLQQIRAVAPVYLVSMSVSAMLWLLTLLPIPMWSILIGQVLLALILYPLVYTLIKQPEFMEMASFVKNKIRKQ